MKVVHLLLKDLLSLCCSLAKLVLIISSLSALNFGNVIYINVSEEVDSTGSLQKELIAKFDIKNFSLCRTKLGLLFSRKFIVLLILSVLGPWNIFVRHLLWGPLPSEWTDIFSSLTQASFSFEEERIYVILPNNNTKVFSEGVIIIIACVQCLERGDRLWLAFRHYCDKYNLYYYCFYFLFFFIKLLLENIVFDKVITLIQ